MNRSLFSAPALQVAPHLLDATLTVNSAEGIVSLRITEVEAYHGVGVPGPYDAGSHSRKQKTERNASMFGAPGHAYVYLSYGLHFAINMVCSPTGAASGVLIRSGEIVQGHELAQRRRSASRTSASAVPARQLARGPGNVAQALGITRAEHDGLDLFETPFSLDFPEKSPARTSTGPRVGVSGEAGSQAFPWRFWITGDPSVSAYRPGRDVPAESVVRGALS